MARTLCLLLVLAAGRAEADVTVLSAAAMRPVLQAAEAAFRTETGQAVQTTYGTAGAVRDQILAGARPDIVVLPPAPLAELVRHGAVLRGSETALGVVRLGAAVRAGMPHPAIGTEDELRATLLAAPSIGLADPASGATTGVYLARLLHRMGLDDALHARIRLYGDGTAAMQALAQGEVSLALGQISEIKPVVGIDLIGPIAEQAQLRTTYAAALAVRAPEDARRFATLLHSPSLAASLAAAGFDPPPPHAEWQGDVDAPDFRFDSGETLSLRLHYTTLGTPVLDASGQVTNAVLALHGTTGTGRNFLAPGFADALFGPGQPLDTARYYVVLPDGIGRGGSSKPSDGLHARFPHYGYGDLVEGQRAVLDALHVGHLRLVLGTSMGGMHAWLWAERHPDMMDAVFPVASQPVAVTGRNLLWRDLVMQAIRSDPDWHDGEYASQPTHYQSVLPLFAIMTGSARTLEQGAETPPAAHAAYDKLVATARATVDANDYLYWFAAVGDYDPEPALGRIRAHVFAVNFADDLLNPVQLGVMARVMPRVADGRFVIVPEGPDSAGHQTQTRAKIWAPYLRQLLDSLPAR